MRLPPPLVALTPGDAGAARSGELEQRVRAALAGGLRGVLLREPELEDGPFEQLAVRLRALLDPLDGWLGLHDRAHLARTARADGVHFGFRSLRPGELREWLPGTALGLSTHAGDEPGSWRAADYVFHGPVHDTPKEPPLEALGCTGLARAVGSTERPVWALGGIGPDDVAAVLRAGVRGVAVLSGVLAQDDPGECARRYGRAIASGGGVATMPPS